MCNCLIVELVGVPGCGKSTTLHGVAKELKKEGKRVLFINETFKSKFRLLLRAFVSWVKYAEDTREERKAWLKYCNSIKNVPVSIKIKIEFFEQLQFLFCYHIILEEGRKYDIILSDQWIYQHAFSILHDQPIESYIPNLKMLDQTVNKLFGKNYVIIKCELDVDKNLKRILQRTDGHSVLDGMDRLALRKIIIQQINNIKYYTNSNLKTNCYSIAFDTDTDSCIANVTSLIRSLRG